MRFHRSIRLGRLVRLNISRSGVGISAGTPGLRVGCDSRGRLYQSAGIPGSGLSTRKSFGPRLPSPLFGVLLGFAAVAALIVAALVVFRHLFT